MRRCGTPSQSSRICISSRRRKPPSVSSAWGRTRRLCSDLVQGGEVTGSIDEKVRHAVTKLANLHFVSTEKAAERVIRMGEDPKTVFRSRSGGRGDGIDR